MLWLWLYIIKDFNPREHYKPKNQQNSILIYGLCMYTNKMIILWCKLCSMKACSQKSLFAVCMDITLKLLILLRGKEANTDPMKGLLYKSLFSDFQT